MTQHKIKNGDRIKILPFVSDCGRIYWGKTYDIARIGATTIFDDSGILSKMVSIHNNKTRGNPTWRPTYLNRKYVFHCYVNGESKLIIFGTTLFKLVEKMTLDVKNNQHILIRMQDKSTPGGNFASFDDSNILNCDWDPPVSDINSSEEWFNWLKANQPSLDIYQNNNLNNSRSKLIEFFGDDLYSEVISKERNNKIEQILK